MLKAAVYTSLTLALSLVATSAFATQSQQSQQSQQRMLQFSNIKTLSSSVSLTQCQALFADVAVDALNPDQAHGKAPILTSSHTTPVTKNFTIFDLSVIEYKAFKPPHALMEDRTLVGLAHVSFDDGKTFSPMPVVANNTTTVATDISVGNIVIGNSCFADMTLTPIKSKA